MLAFTIVIDLNKPKNHCSCLLNCCEIMLVQELDLERVKEALARCVIITISFAAHACLELVRLNQFLIKPWGCSRLAL